MPSPQWNPCWDLIIVQAKVFGPVTGQIQTGITGMATGMEVAAYHYPLIISATNAMYAFIDHKAQQFQDQQLEQAKKRGGVKF
jgi:hypothetical protein